MCDSGRCPQATHHPCHRPIWAEHADKTKTFRRPSARPADREDPACRASTTAPSASWPRSTPPPATETPREAQRRPTPSERDPDPGSHRPSPARADPGEREMRHQDPRPGVHRPHRVLRRPPLHPPARRVRDPARGPGRHRRAQ